MITWHVSKLRSQGPTHSGLPHGLGFLSRGRASLGPTAMGTTGHSGQGSCVLYTPEPRNWRLVRVEKNGEAVSGEKTEGVAEASNRAGNRISSRRQMSE